MRTEFERRKLCIAREVGFMRKLCTSFEPSAESVLFFKTIFRQRRPAHDVPTHSAAIRSFKYGMAQAWVVRCEVSTDGSGLTIQTPLKPCLLVDFVADMHDLLRNPDVSDVHFALRPVEWQSVKAASVPGRMPIKHFMSVRGV